MEQRGIAIDKSGDRKVRRKELQSGERSPGFFVVSEPDVIEKPITVGTLRVCWPNVVGKPITICSHEGERARWTRNAGAKGGMPDTSFM